MIATVSKGAREWATRIYRRIIEQPVAFAGEVLHQGSGALFPDSEAICGGKARGISFDGKECVGEFNKRPRASIRRHGKKILSPRVTLILSSR